MPQHKTTAHLPAATRAWAARIGAEWIAGAERFVTPAERDYWRSLAEAKAERERQSPRSEEATCGVCGGLGVVRHNVPRDHADFGKHVPCPVAGCPARQKAERERYAKLSSAAAIPEIYKGLTFAKWQLLIDEQREGMNGKWDAYMAARAFCAAEDHVFTLSDAAELFGVQPAVSAEAAIFASNSIVFTGKNGVGKTSLAVSIAHQLLDDGKAAVYTRLDDYFSALKATFDDKAEERESDVSALYANAPVLIIDELTPDRKEPTDWQCEKVHMLINARYTRHLPTIITTNSTEKQFYDLWGPTVESRVKTFHWIEVRGKVLRPRSEKVESR